MSEIRFTVQGIARPKGSAKAFMGPGSRFPIVTSDNKNLKQWERSIRDVLQTVLPTVPREMRLAIWDAPVSVSLAFHLPRPQSLPKRVTQHTKKPDVDKLVRGAIDPLIGMVIRDDSQVVAIEARKCYAEVGSHIDVVVRIADGPLFQPGNAKDV